MIELTVRKALLLTSNQRLHWAVRAERTRTLRHLAKVAARGTRADTPTRAVVTVHYPDRRRRDAGNLAPTAKALIDGCVDARIIPDDSTEYLEGVDTRIGHWPGLQPGMAYITIDFRAP